MALVNAFGDIALDASVQDVKSSVDALLTDEQLRATPVPVSGTVTANTGLSQPLTDAQLRASSVPIAQEASTKYKWSSDKVTAANEIDTDYGTIIYRSSGMTVTQNNGNMVATLGTTAYDELMVRGVATFTGTGMVRVPITFSQRIANNNVSVMLTDVVGDSLPVTINSATSVTVTKTAHGFTSSDVGKGIWIGCCTVASCPAQRATIASIPTADTITLTVSGFPSSGTGTCTLYGYNYYQVLYSGTSATALGGGFNVQRKGWQTAQASVTVSSTTTGHLLVFDIPRANDVSLLDQILTSGTGNQMTARATANINTPDFDSTLYLQIHAYNGSSAPASSTTITRATCDCEKYNPTMVNISSVTSSQLKNALSVSVQNTPNVGTVTTVTTCSAVTAANLNFPQIIADVASGALTTTTTTSAITPTFGATYIVQIPVTAVSGTNPTLDVGVEESDDSGTNWYRVYDFPRITATGAYRSPPLTMRGNRVRYVQTVAGTSPSFTRAVNRLQRSDDAPLRVQFIDRTIVPNTLNSTTSTYFIEGCRDFNVVVRCTAQTGAATIALQVSNDGTNFLTLSTTLATINGTAQAKYTNEMWKFGRLIVTAAGSGITLGEAVITGISA